MSFCWGLTPTPITEPIIIKFDPFIILFDERIIMTWFWSADMNNETPDLILGWGIFNKVKIGILIALLVVIGEHIILQIYLIFILDFILKFDLWEGFQIKDQPLEMNEEILGQLFELMVFVDTLYFFIAVLTVIVCDYLWLSYFLETFP